MRLTRRKFCASLAAVGISTATYVFGVEPHWIEVVERPLPITALPNELIGARLIQLSDIHVGPIVDDDYLIRAFELVRQLEPDLLVITGDFMSYREPAHIDQTARVFEHLVLPRWGTIGILGNHDYGARWKEVEVANQLARRLRDLGMDVLRNQTKVIKGLQVIGVEDYWGPYFSPEEVLAARDKTAAQLVLCHNPDAADAPVWSDYQGWILSGHTHGGQCRFPFGSAPILPIKNPLYAAGEVDLHDGRRLYVNRALGYLRRVRCNVRPEITVFTLSKSLTQSDPTRTKAAKPKARSGLS